MSAGWATSCPARILRMLLLRGAEMRPRQEGWDTEHHSKEVSCLSISPAHPPNDKIKIKSKTQSPLEDAPFCLALDIHCLMAKIRKAFPSRGVLKLSD